MGIYVNPGNVLFRRALNSEVYIDKTALIDITNSRIDTSDCFTCVSRPRRFGKSMAADMLVAYYSKGCDSDSLFAGKEIEKRRSFKSYLNQFNVIRLDVQRFFVLKIASGHFYFQNAGGRYKGTSVRIRKLLRNQ